MSTTAQTITAEQLAELKEKAQAVLDENAKYGENSYDPGFALGDTEVAYTRSAHPATVLALFATIEQQRAELERLRDAPAGEQGGYPHNEMDALAMARYKIGTSGHGSILPFAVRAGDGEQEIYRGSKASCAEVARKLAGAFLDGGLSLYDLLSAAPAAPAPAAQEPEIFGLVYRIDGQVVIQTVGDPHVTDGMAVYTAPPAAEQSGVEQLVTNMVNRFLGWKLPQDFSPDAGTSFAPPSNPAWWPTGTNLLSADQAKAMFEYALQGCQAAEQPDTVKVSRATLRRYADHLQTAGYNIAADDLRAMLAGGDA